MKKKSILSIGCLLVTLGIATYLLYKGLETEVVDPYRQLNHVSVDDFFEKEEEYFIFAQRAECPYCDNVQEEVIEFAENNQLYVLDTRDDSNSSIKDYDWNEHHSLYDQEIGDVINGEMVLYNGMSEADLEDEYSPLYYSIRKADEDFVELNVEKKLNKIYAISESPIIDYSNATEKNLVIAAVPTLFHIKDGEVREYYFGDAQILDFFGSEKKPLGKYIE